MLYRGSGFEISRNPDSPEVIGQAPEVMGKPDRIVRACHLPYVLMGYHFWGMTDFLSPHPYLSKMS